MSSIENIKFSEGHRGSACFILVGWKGKLWIILIGREGEGLD
jgi:hypothetical protein